MPAFDPSRLRAIRERRELTREQLARLTGKTSSAVAKIEGGVIAPSSSTLGRLAGALGCTVNDLYDPDRDDREGAYDAELQQIVAGLPPLDTDRRRRLAVLLAQESA